MIRTLRGRFHPQTDGTCVIETDSGIGFLVNIPSNSPLYKNVEGEDVRVYTAMIVREDDMSLYGFDSMDELDLFKLLITVNGVGAKAGMSIMGVLPVMELKRAIALGDTKSISAASGIGKKIAERVVLELKDKVGEFAGEEMVSIGSDVPFTNERNEAVNALVSLGYSKSEAEAAVRKVTEDDLAAEDYIKKALKEMI